MQFLCSIWKILHQTEYFYTGTTHGARNNYQIWPCLKKLKTEIHTLLFNQSAVNLKCLCFDNVLWQQI